MTALNPDNEKEVRGVLAQRYPLNSHCAHPECNRTDVTAHHIFPRSHTGNGSWFVELAEPGAGFTGVKKPPIADKKAQVIPHVVGLCGHGTAGHHGQVETHEAWIKYEDGEFVWYDRLPDVSEVPGFLAADWKCVGPLNPQPGGKEKQKAPRRRSQAPGRLRTTWPIKVPKDKQEDGAELLDALIEEGERLMGHDPPRSKYFTVADLMSMGVLWLKDQQ